MYDTLFWGLKQNLQLKNYLPTKFQASKIIGLAALAFFSDVLGVLGSNGLFFMYNTLSWGLKQNLQHKIYFDACNRDYGPISI